MLKILFSKGINIVSTIIPSFLVSKFRMFCTGDEEDFIMFQMKEKIK